MKIVLATQNQHKVKEILQIWEPFPFQILTLRDFPDFLGTIEDGKTFEENSLKKAREVSRFTRLIAVADDSGIEVEGLGAAPGIYSARFAGEKATDEQNNQKLLDLLKDYPIGHPARKARFRCVASLVTPEGKEWVSEGVVEGEILKELRGVEGFGYDPLFLLPEHGITTAELSLEEKNLVSHRGKAFRKVKEVLLHLK